MRRAKCIEKNGLDGCEKARHYLQRIGELISWSSSHGFFAQIWTLSTLPRLANPSSSRCQGTNPRFIIIIIIMRNVLSANPASSKLAVVAMQSATGISRCQM